MGTAAPTRPFGGCCTVTSGENPDTAGTETKPVDPRYKSLTTAVKFACMVLAGVDNAGVKVSVATPDAFVVAVPMMVAGSSMKKNETCRPVTGALSAVRVSVACTVMGLPTAAGAPPWTPTNAPVRVVGAAPMLNVRQSWPGE